MKLAMTILIALLASVATRADTIESGVWLSLNGDEVVEATALYDFPAWDGGSGYSVTTMVDKEFVPNGLPVNGLLPPTDVAIAESLSTLELNLELGLLEHAYTCEPSAIWNLGNTLTGGLVAGDVKLSVPFGTAEQGLECFKTVEAIPNLSPTNSPVGNNCFVNEVKSIGRGKGTVTAGCWNPADPGVPQPYSGLDAAVATPESPTSFYLLAGLGALAWMALRSAGAVRLASSDTGGSSRADSRARPTGNLEARRALGGREF